MKNSLLIFSASVFFLFSCGNKVFRTAEKHYTAYEFAAASQLYEAVLKSDTGNSKAMLHLADCYRQMNRHAESEKWYAKSVRSTEATPADKLHYAEVLRENGKYSEAATWYDEYLKADPQNTSVIFARQSCDKVQQLSRSNPFWTISEVVLSTQGSVFGPHLYGNEVLVAAESQQSPSNTSNWTGRGYIKLYSMTNDSAPRLTAIDGLDFDRNVGPGVISSDGRYLYFTRNILVDEKDARATDNDNHLEICVAEKSADGKWGNVVSLPFNNKEYSCGHPALTPDGMRMYFTSDMPGGYGGTDIYFSNYINGAWSKPENVGECVNTNGNEMFPVVNSVHAGFIKLFYSSDGLEGLGGLDLYESPIKDGACTRGSRLELPFNSPQDDFGIVFRNDGKSGYFASNRNSEDGTDRLYSFKRVEPSFYVRLEVRDKATSALLPDSPVEIRNATSGKTISGTTGADGMLTIAADSVTAYSFTVRRSGYFAGFGSVRTAGFSNKFSDTAYAVVTVEQIVINKPIRLDNIYYDYNKWNIRPDAAIELDKLVKIMLDNPAISIELSSHTDCRGSDKYNQTLSQKRAQSAVDYIISKGIAKSRITAKGEGENKLLNKCDDGVKCTEEEHQWNRRTEFKVTHIAYPDTQTP
ncbi:MAG: OmpA family protein [Bacteroidia bacterium]|nr:OmpA family protein [Bacteroidia bacterium]